jgi:hypothetical protein
VLDSDPKTSLAKSPNAQLVALYTILQADFFQLAGGIFIAWREMYQTIQDDRRFSLSRLSRLEPFSLSNAVFFETIEQGVSGDA